MQNGDFIAGPAAQNANNWANRDYFRRTAISRSRHPVHRRTPFGSTNEESVGTSPISRRMTDTDGNFAGVVVIGVRLAYFRDLFSRLELGPARLGDAAARRWRHSDAAAVRSERYRPHGRCSHTVPHGSSQAGCGIRHDVRSDRSCRATGSRFHRVGTLPLIVSVGVATEGVCTSRRCCGGAWQQHRSAR